MNMKNWKTYKLCEVANLFTGFPFDGQKYTKEGQRVVRGDNITIGALRWDADKDKRWNETFSRAKEFSLQEGDIVIGMDGSRVGRNRAQIKVSDLPLLLAQRVACIRHNSQTLQKFLYYQIFSNRFENYIKSVHTGTSIPHVSLKQIGDFSFQVPDLFTQQRITNILSALDDKIELNRRINENLEQQAQALFKSWFVDFEPFQDGKFVDSELGMIPEGWKVGTIGNYSNIRSGFAFKSSWWTDKGVKIVKIKNISSSGNLDMNDCSYVSKENTLKAKEFSLKPGDLLIAMTGATIGKFCIVPILKEEMYVNQRVGKFFLGEEPILKVPFIYGLLKSENIISQIINKGQGSAQPNISANDIETISIILPPKDIISKYNELVSPYFSLLIKNLNECDYLAQLRDILLPKLMSGELQI